VGFAALSPPYNSGSSYTQLSFSVSPGGLLKIACDRQRERNFLTREGQAARWRTRAFHQSRRNSAGALVRAPA